VLKFWKKFRCQRVNDNLDIFWVDWDPVVTSWPPMSPILCHYDSYSWDYIEGLNYSQKSTAAEELKTSTQEYGSTCSSRHVTVSVDKTGLLSVHVMQHTLHYTTEWTVHYSDSLTATASLHILIKMSSVCSFLGW
jgi:hypothetical protein